MKVLIIDLPWTMDFVIEERYDALDDESSVALRPRLDSPRKGESEQVVFAPRQPRAKGHGVRWEAPSRYCSA